MASHTRFSHNVWCGDCPLQESFLELLFGFVGCVPLAVLKKLKGTQHSQWPIDPMEQAAALSLTSLQFVARREAASESGPSAAISIVLNLSSGFPQVLSTEPVITKIYSPYENVLPAIAIDMEATLSPIRKYFCFVRIPIHPFIRVW